ncbi:ABC transporter substrate-binding protein [Paraglaciecola aquimarina]|uniref:ABC transporter substrate-binding protein n=1 Tax=Paraglaciecola aquimarina TaxID=1235557 RepID=A0ABU3SZT7_9ALTE|nr:ABC transporter substrate-binding protein [Paraglaciecola aquimarina]MDU0355529.1 ABC transporter substrate-binding protein [Paraglaciecola aquimarina]
MYFKFIGTMISFCLPLGLYFAVSVFCSSVLADDGQSSQTEVVLLVNADDTFPFWQSEVDFYQAVGDALDINVDVHYVPGKYRDRFGVVGYIKNYLNDRQHPPTLVMSAFLFGAEEKLLALLNEQSIPFISLNSYVSAQQFVELGKPRERFPLWLGHFSPNDIQVGKQLMQALLSLYRKRNNCTKTKCGANVFGFTGLPYAAVSQQRVEGVRRAVHNDPKSHLFNNVAANWRRAIALEKMATVVGRHSDIDIFWAASDNMAWGIVDGLKKYQYKHDVLVGSIDWSPNTIPFIENGQIDISFGGHFLEAGLALIFYYDYLHGIDFAKKYGTIVEIEMSQLSKENVHRIGPFLIEPKWNKRILYNYSKFNNRDRKEYLLAPLDIINQQLN